MSAIWKVSTRLFQCWNKEWIAQCQHAVVFLIVSNNLLYHVAHYTALVSTSHQHQHHIVNINLKSMTQLKRQRLWNNSGKGTDVGNGERESKRGSECVLWVCVMLAHDSFIFWNRRKLCNKILPSQGHQFYVSNTWINQINGSVCVRVCIVSSVANFTNFLFVYWYYLRLRIRRKKGKLFIRWDTPYNVHHPCV